MRELLILRGNDGGEILGGLLHRHLAGVDFLRVALEELAAGAGFLFGHLGGLALLARQLGVLLVGEGGKHIVEVIVGVLKIGAQVVVRDLVRAALAVDGVKQFRVHHARLAVGDNKGILSDVLLHGIRDIAPRGGGQALGLGLLVLRQRDAESVELVAQIVDFLGVAKSLGTDPVLRGLAVDLLIKQGDRAVHALLLPGRVDGGIEVVHVHADRQTVAVFLGAPALIGGGAAGRAERQNDGERQSGKL